MEPEKIVCEACKGVGCGACHEGHVYFEPASPASPQVGEMLEQECRELLKHVEVPDWYGTVNLTAYDESVAEKFAEFIRTKLRAALAESDARIAAARAEARLEEAESWLSEYGADATISLFEYWARERIEKLRALAAQPTPAPKEQADAKSR